MSNAIHIKYYMKLSSVKIRCHNLQFNLKRLIVFVYIYIFLFLSQWIDAKCLPIYRVLYHVGPFYLFNVLKELLPRTE